MKSEEYVTTVVFNGKMINIGLDDFGQCYFIEFLDDNGQLVQEACYNFCSSYLDYIEDRFGGCANCKNCLTKWCGPQAVGFVCGRDFKDIPVPFSLIPPCEEKKEK